MNVKDKRNIVHDEYWTPMYLPRDERFQEGGEFIKNATKANLRNSRKTTKGVMAVQKKQIRDIENKLRELKQLYDKGEISKGDYDWAVATYNNDIYYLREILAEEQHEDIERLNDIIQTRRDKYRERTGTEDDDIAAYMATQQQRRTKCKCGTGLATRTKQKSRTKSGKKTQRKSQIPKSGMLRIAPITPQNFVPRVSKSLNASTEVIKKLNKMSIKIK